MKCVRCLHDTASKVADAPDGSGAWEVYLCSRCNFSWRNSEEEEVINPEKRDPWSQEGFEDLNKLIAPCPIPPLAK